MLNLARSGQHIQIDLTTEEVRKMVSLPTDLMVATELEFIGTTGMQPNRYGELIDLVAAGELDPSKIISEEIALEDVSETLERMANFETQGIPVITSF